MNRKGEKKIIENYMEKQWKIIWKNSVFSSSR